MRTQHIRSIALSLLVVLAAPLPALAQEAGTLDPELTTRCRIEVKRLKARGMDEAAKELQHQFDLYAKDAKTRQAVIDETAKRIQNAREAFKTYYQQLIAEGQPEGAERMRQLFEISIKGAPLTASAPAK